LFAAEPATYGENLAEGPDLKSNILHFASLLDGWAREVARLGAGQLRGLWVYCGGITAYHPRKGRRYV
jgi:hypothetical protein